MTAVAYTMFLDTLVTGFTGNAPEAFYSEFLADMNTTVRYGTSFYYRESVSLDATDSRLFNVDTGSAAWTIFVIRMVGEGYFTAVCKDYDNTTNITAILPAYGVSYFPGYIIWSTQRYVSGANLTATLDGTTAEVMFFRGEED